MLFTSSLPVFVALNNLGVPNSHDRCYPEWPFHDIDRPSNDKHGYVGQGQWCLKRLSNPSRLLLKRYVSPTHLDA